MVLMNRFTLLLIFCTVNTIADNNVTIKCAEVISDYFYNTRICIFRNVVVSNATILNIDTHYDGAFIHKGLFKTLKFESSQMATIPAELFRNFFNAERVYMNDSEINEITGESFMYAMNVREIYLDHNQISELEDEVFSKASQASSIDLSHNMLTHLNSEAFANLMQLRRLYLSYNRITNVPADAFHRIPSLSVIKLDNNLIKQVDYSIFAENSFVEDINFSHNGLMELQLHLTGNRLQKLDATANNIQKFFLKSTLETNNVSVNLSHNKLVQFCMPEKVEIVVLNVENNRLGKSLIEISNITSVKSLRELYLGFNSLPPLEADTFSALKELKYLGLPSIELLELRKEVFEPLDQLTYLDISYNPLRIIDLNALTSLTSLASLFINGDELNGMDIKNIKSYIPKIFEIQVSDTDWNCAHLEETITEMRNQSVYIVANPNKYIRKRKNIHGIACYGSLLNGTYTFFEEDLERTKKEQQENNESIWDVNWIILGASIVAGILGIYLIIKTIIFCSRKYDDDDDDNGDNFSEIVYTSD